MIRILETEKINTGLFVDFKRHQQVTKCWRKIYDKWVIVDNPFTEDWSKEQYEYLVKCLRNTILTGGIVFGAFQDQRMVGFTSVEAKHFGSRKQYMELSSIHVSEESRGSGIGRGLIECAKGWAKEHGAEKLYISAHSSIESQAFYKAVGCKEAEEYSRSHVEKEPCDCQLELAV
ncbi:MAG: GNAT family N-acetyltransferase [Clostridiales bacterium]|nr:GNAT family N-acetyltransferase [Clostridiales bacterium]